MAVSDILKKYIKTSVGAGIKATAGIAAPSAGALLNRVSSQRLGGAAVRFGKETAQSTLRGYAGVADVLQRVGAKTAQKITGQKFDIQPLTPSTILQRKIYGTNEPLTAARSGSELGIPKTSKFAAPVGFALAAMDLFPGGKGVKPALIKSLKVINKADDAADVISRSLKLTREVAMKYADDAARFTDEKQLGKLIDTILTKEKPMGISVKNLVSKADDVSDPLLTEARKGETVTLYRAAPKFPSDKFDKGTYFADDAGKARYYSESHYGGNPQDIKVEQFTLPKDAVFKEPSTGNYILKSEAPVLKATSENALIAEARKYKSAEEFMKSQGTPIFRAGEPRAKPMSESTFYTPDKDATGEYNLSGKAKIFENVVDESRLFKGDSSVQYAIDNGLMDKPMSPDLQKLTGLKTLREVDDAYAEGVGSNASKAYQQNPNIFFTAFQQTAAKELRQKGFSGARWAYEDDLTPTQYQIWDNSIVKDQSQLTSIWKKAQAIGTPSPQRTISARGSGQSLSTTPQGGQSTLGIRPPKATRPRTGQAGIQPPASSMTELTSRAGVDLPESLKRSLPYDEGVSDAGKVVNPPVVRGGIKPPELNFSSWKDRPTPLLSRETLERNLDTVAGKESAKVKDFIVNPTRKNETTRVSFVNKVRDEIRELIVKGKGIRAGSKEDQLIQQFGEGTISLEQLKGATKKWKQVQEAAEYFRGKYDELLDMVNAERTRFDYTPIPKRKDYFRHFQEIDNAITQFGLILREQDLPTEIAGMTGIFNPGKPFSTAELRRFGTKTTESAIKGMDNYLDSISKQIFHIDSVQRGRALEKYIRESAKTGEGDVKLSNFVANLHDYTNLVAGKKAALDRAFEAIMGRPVYGLLNKLRTQVSANMIGGNVSSAITNFIPFTQSLATTEKVPALRGLFESLSSPLKSNYAEIGETTSSFLTRRFPVKAVDPRGLKKASEIANWLFETVDRFTAKSIVSGKFYEQLGKGLGAEKAMRLADEYAGKVMADRSIGQLPNLMSTKTLGFVTQFQTEINNQMSFILKDIPKFAEGKKVKIVSSLTQLFVYSYLFNEGFERVTGRRPALDPIYAALTVAGLTDEGDDRPLLDRAKIAGKDIAGNLPFVGGITGGRLPVGAAFESPAAFAAYILAPFGGGQIKKTLGGIGAMREKGVFKKDGDLQFEIAPTPLNKIRLLLFGKYGTPEAREYFNSKNPPKSAYDKAREALAVENEQMKAAVTPIFEQAQSMLSEGNEEGARELVESLSDEEYAAYKKLKSAWQTDQKRELKETIYPVFVEVQTLLDEGKDDEAREIVESMRDEEYEAYESIKKSGLDTAIEIGEGDEANVIKVVVTYAKAFNVDPETAFKTMFGKEVLSDVYGDAAIMERLPREESEAIRRERGVTSDNKDTLRLDHTVPLSLGGDNSEGNLQLVATSVWEQYTKVEKYLYQRLKAGKIKEKDAQRLIREFKEGKITAEDIYNF